MPFTSKAFEKLLIRSLDDIAKHGHPERYRQYFPTYLLKAIQDWFAHHGDELYQELKHVRNQLCDIEVLLRERSPQAEDVAAPIAAAHAVLAVQNRRKKQPDAKQLNLL